MAQWLSYSHKGQAGFGVLNGERIDVHVGDMFATPRSNGEQLDLADVQLGLPCVPGKFIGLWNNYHAQAVKQNLAIPLEPLYFIKAASSYAAHGQDILQPDSYDGRVVYEGELGLVIGKPCKNLSVKMPKTPFLA